MTDHDSAPEQLRADEASDTPEDVTPQDKPARKPRAKKVAGAEADEATTPRKRQRRKKVSKPATLALPVIITDETVLLPHMSIPYPIQDDETSLAIDRAMRMTPRLVLLLT